MALLLACDDPGARSPAPPEPAAAPGVAVEADEPAAETSPAAEALPRRRVATLEHEGRTFEAEFAGEAELPSDFPDDVPLYEGALPLSSMSAGGRGIIVNLRTGDAPPRVFAFYRDGMQRAGWRIENEVDYRGQYTLTTSKGNRRATVSITGSDEATQILLTVAEDR